MSFTRFRLPVPLVLAVVATAPGLVTRLGSISLPPLVRAGLYGVAIVGASLLLAWAAELAQLDISPALAIGGLALVAVLPEYVVGTVFAWRGGHAVARFGGACQSPASRAVGHDSSCTLALANMMGANRLLIGIGWSLVVLLAWRRRRALGQRLRGVNLGRQHCVEVAFLALACLYCLSVPLRRTVSLIDSVVLIVIFAGYGWRVAQAPSEAPELEGVAEWLGRLPDRQRRTAAGALMALAATVIFLCANPFADALVASGSVLGVQEFFLVQWLAPFASEAPELLIAGIYAWRLRAATGLGALVSSKINQWTILVASLPIAFALASRSAHGLPLAGAQRQELALTAAQSVFGVAVLGNLELSTTEGVALFTLFSAEFLGGALAPAGDRGAIRIGFTVTYLLLGGAILFIKRRDTVALVRDGFRTPYADLGGP